MKKKIIVGCVIIMIVVVSMTMVSAVNTKKSKKKTSPIFNLRTNRAINFNFDAIKSRFINNERLFFSPEILSIQESYINSRHNFYAKWRSNDLYCLTYEGTVDCGPCLNLGEENREPVGYSILPTRCLGHKTSLCEPTSCNDWQCLN